LGRDDAAAAALVLDHDAAKHRLDIFRPQAGNHIHHAAGRTGHDDPDRLLRKLVLTGGKWRARCRQRKGGEAEFEEVTSAHAAIDDEITGRSSLADRCVITSPFAGQLSRPGFILDWHEQSAGKTEKSIIALTFCRAVLQ
jgi:hypothetical protein